eukprot:SM000268S09753  [mRNA]  locus=s268:3304:3993:- [translate_table: standard]
MQIFLGYRSEKTDGVLDASHVVEDGAPVWQAPQEAQELPTRVVLGRALLLLQQFNAAEPGGRWMSLLLLPEMLHVRQLRCDRCLSCLSLISSSFQSPGLTLHLESYPPSQIAFRNFHAEPLRDALSVSIRKPILVVGSDSSERIARLGSMGPWSEKAPVALAATFQ